MTATTTREITKDLLVTRSKGFKKMAFESEREAQAIENKIEGVVDQIQKVESSSVIQRLGQRIDAMEWEKRKTLADAASLRTNFPSNVQVNEKVFDFLANPKKYWVAGNLKQKMLVQTWCFLSL